METFFIVPVRTAFHRVRIQPTVYKDFDCGTVYVNIGSQFHAGRVLRRVEMAVQRIGVHVVANHSLSEQVKARIGGVRQLDSCLDAKTIGIIKFFQVAVCLVRSQRFQ